MATKLNQLEYITVLFRALIARSLSGVPAEIDPEEEEWDEDASCGHCYRDFKEGQMVRECACCHRLTCSNEHGLLPEHCASCPEVVGY